MQGEKMSPIRRDFGPGDLERVQSKVGLDGSIAVQARQSLKESRWLLELAARDARIKGVVGWVDLRSESVEAELEELSPNEKFVGVRHVVHDEPDDEFMFIDKISKVKFKGNYQPTSEREFHLCNSLVNYGVFSKHIDSSYKPTREGKRLLSM